MGTVNSTKKPALIFDLDGVLVYTDKYHFAAWKKMGRKHGLTVDDSLDSRLRGVSRMESLAIILDYNEADLPEEKKQELAAEKNGYYNDLLSELSRDDMVAGSMEFVEEAREAGHPLAVASSSKNAGTVLSALGIESLFGAVITGHDITRTKPDPQIFQLAGERLEMSPEECIVFEDAESGIQAAKAALMQAVFVAPEGATPPADLDADATINGFAGVRLADVLERLGR
jgi:beta-phosphoglucomutase